MQNNCRIYEICGDYGLEINYGDKRTDLFFNNRDNAELVKKILEYENGYRNASVPYITKIKLRWTPCRYCEGGKTIYHEKGMKYCPECGRPLTQEAWEEWKKRMMG